MSSILPPPLPDAPASLVAPVAYQTPHAYTLRPVGRLTRFWMKLPLPAMLVCAALLLLKQCSSGSDFRHNSTHALVRIFDVVVFGSAAGASLLLGAIVLTCTWRRLDRGTRAWVVAASISALVVGGLSLFATETVFQWGKSRAYGRVNPTALTADCASMAAAPVRFVSSSGEYTYASSDPIVPAYTRSLGARWVRVTPRGVYVIMSTDLFAGVHEEGYFVPTAPLGLSPQAYAASNRMSVISAQPPVFRY
jgi:hypothetical protein